MELVRKIITGASQRAFGTGPMPVPLQLSRRRDHVDGWYLAAHGQALACLWSLLSLLPQLEFSHASFEYFCSSFKSLSGRLLSSVKRLPSFTITLPLSVQGPWLSFDYYFPD